ncbi:predicted protein [Arabidopsis lyrata subsp. lyrata]|uniref:Predicted protein n=1 Tax=Arabidopsis lyrata subsp. lyrata TaxID=81972 RepID=D7MVQ5_ARALL|nr:predicted protein [Arabidopsis lyrata subsp. lyrata]
MKSTKNGTIVPSQPSSTFTKPDQKSNPEPFPIDYPERKPQEKMGNLITHLTT